MGMTYPDGSEDERSTTHKVCICLQKHETVLHACMHACKELYTNAPKRSSNRMTEFCNAWRGDLTARERTRPLSEEAARYRGELSQLLNHKEGEQGKAHG